MVSQNAAQEYRPGEIAAICGMTEVSTSELENRFKEPMGSFIYTIEYSDGTDSQVPQSLLTEVNEDV